MVSLNGISPINPGSPPLVSGGIVSGSIGGPLGVKEYTFTGKTGDIISLSSTNMPVEAGFLELEDVYAPSGTKIGSFFAGGTRPLTLAETGTFMVAVHDTDYVQKGTFTLGLEGLKPISPGSTPLVKGGFVSGSITTPIDIKAFTFSASANNIIQFSMGSTATQAGFNAQADIYTPSGTHISTTLATIPIVITVHETGQFLVLVHDNGYVNTGTFVLGLEGVTPPSPDVLALAAGATMNGTISANNDVHEFAFYADATDQMTFTLSGTPSQAGYVAAGAIYSPAGVRVSDFLGTTVSRHFTAATTGVYMLQIKDANYKHTGSFGISVLWTPTVASSISGNAFNDTNSDGTRQTGETGAAGRTIFIDANNNGKLDSGERSTATDVLGNYAFDSLNAGTTIVREILPGGLRFTGPVTGMYSVVLGAGSNVGGKNFGTAPAAVATAQISGQVYNDSNGNGARDVGELGLGLWTVFIDKNTNGKLDAGDLSITTDINGAWTFKHLAAGTYVIRVVQPTRTASTSPVSGSLTLPLATGQVLSNELFGEKSLT